MGEFFSSLLSSDEFMPHGHCYFWTPSLVWLHVISDSLIGLAYFSIPITLVLFIRKRRDIPFNWMFLAFGAFILSCGATHMMEVWTVWNATYWLSGFIKLITAATSVVTAVLLIRLAPMAVKLPSPLELENLNREKEREIVERMKVEDRLRSNEQELEQRVIERTAELESMNQTLQKEIEERKHAEEKFRLAVEGSPSAMIMINNLGRIVLVNSQTEALFGYTRSELLNEAIEILVPDNQRRGHLTFRSGFLSEPVARPMGAGRDLFGRRKDGSEIPVEIGLNPLVTSEGWFVLASIIDIRERKQAEERIRVSLREKEILLKEIHHRVKNNLQVIASLLDMQSSYCKDPLVREMFRESRDRAHSMALIHERLYQSQNLDRIDLSEYLKTLANDLYSSYGVNSESIRLNIDMQSILVNIDTANSCGLVVHELVSNALKHAFPDGRQGTLTVRLAIAEGKDNLSMRLIVSDNGCGFPHHINFRNTESLGLQLVVTLIEQLQGTITLDTAKGTEFDIRFSETQYKRRV